ncbi:MAG: hypothetical protein IT381_22590 [Deltaproteobacteria bacterium]|nr:hypothetical protein [Deltaproteobacteria bacterium]
MIARVLVIVGLCIACGVKGSPRPPQPALPPPVTVPGPASAPAEPAP